MGKLIKTAFGVAATGVALKIGYSMLGNISKEVNSKTKRRYKK